MTGFSQFMFANDEVPPFSHKTHVRVFINTDLEHLWTGPSGGRLLEAGGGSGRRLNLMPGHADKVTKNRVHFELRKRRNRSIESIDRREFCDSRSPAVG